ncbi:spiroplasma plectrovirus-related protein [Spiroplasma phoeniceum P40]|uniref:Spiroplasma plectrovirus-related protein n=1 Tax=Spiroplasma phoeniceum P40 TaxID=1276259 RepID=A0A345DSE4_9MOLU|nr:spiroplasma plectrovirus-related protein [Spiroplasma phoeniceum P40]
MYLKKIVENVERYKENRYPRVGLNQDNWKLINYLDKPFNEVDNKYYFVIWRETMDNN